MNYVWDDGKSTVNLQKHGLSFEDAALVFSGACVTFEDDRYDYGEPRYYAGYPGRPRCRAGTHTTA